MTRFFGIDKDIRTKTKENIYKVVIAAAELAKKKTGALIIIERDIKLQDIADTGILINGESNKENDKKDSMVLNASENKDQRNNNQACCFSFVKK